MTIQSLDFFLSTEADVLGGFEGGKQAFRAHSPNIRMLFIYFFYTNSVKLVNFPRHS